MGKYIAAKPVRFDRNYEVGEIIPDEAINPGRVKRLIEREMIQPVVTPAEGMPPLAGFIVHHVVFAERMLQISYKDGPVPSLDERVEICAARCAELIKFIEQANAGDAEQAAVAGVSESMDGMPGEGEQINDDIPHVHQLPEDAEDAPQEDSEEASGATSFVCQTCGKVCANKAALTSHMKTHG